MYAIFAQSKNGAIGYNGELPWNIPEDLRFFKKTTNNNIVIMGRKTYESLKSAAPLKNRINIVLSSNPPSSSSPQPPNLYWAKTIDEVLSITENFPDKKTFIIGGSSIYKLFSNYIDVYYMTYINKICIGDAFIDVEFDTEKWATENIQSFYSENENCIVDIVKKSRIAAAREDDGDSTSFYTF